MAVNDRACARQSSKFGSDTSMWGQRLQENGVDHREEPDRESEPERQREGGGKSEAGLSAQAADRVPQVLAALVREVQPAPSSVLVLARFGSSGRWIGEPGGHDVAAVGEP